MSLLYNTLSQNTNPYDTEIYKWIMKNNDYKEPTIKLLRTIQKYFSKKLCIQTERKDYRKKGDLINWLHIHSQKIFSYVSMKGSIKIEYDHTRYIALQSINDQQIDSLIMKIKNMHIKPVSKPQLKPTFESRICKFSDILKAQKFPIPQINFIKQMSQSKSLPNISPNHIPLK